MSEHDKDNILEEAEKIVFIQEGKEAARELVARERPPKMIEQALINDKTWADYYEYRKNRRWFEQNLESITQEHEGQIVLVFNRAIVFASEDAEEAREKLRSLGDQMNQCYVHYIPKGNELLLVSSRQETTYSQ